MTELKAAEKGRGRPSASMQLSRDHIATTALRLMAKKGVDAFSVRDLAKELGVYPTAVYWHMPTRADIFAAVIDLVLRDLSPPARTGHWQDWLRQLFRRYRDAVMANPAVAPLLGAKLVSNAGISFELIEKILQTLAEAGFGERDIVHAFNVVIAAKVGFVTLELAALPDDDRAWAESFRQQVQTVNVEVRPLLARHLPQLTNRAFMLRWENGASAPMDDSFEAYIDVVLLGLEALLARQQDGASGGSRAHQANKSTEGMRSKLTPP